MVKWPNLSHMASYVAIMYCIAYIKDDKHVIYSFYIRLLIFNFCQNEIFNFCKIKFAINIKPLLAVT